MVNNSPNIKKRTTTSHLNSMNTIGLSNNWAYA